MSKKLISIILVCIFGLILSVSVLAYNSLKEKYLPPDQLQMASENAGFSKKDSTKTNDSGDIEEAKDIIEQADSADTEAESSPENTAEADAPPEEGQPDGEESESGLTPAPDFVMLDSSGDEVKLSDMFGKSIVLNFWASWCPPCKEEMPSFNKVYEELGEDITFMMVDLTDGNRETVESGKKYIEDQGYTFPVYYDFEQEASYIYGISSIPTSFFINSKGEVVTYARGMIDEETLRKGISFIASDTE